MRSRPRRRGARGSGPRRASSLPRLLGGRPRTRSPSSPPPPAPATREPPYASETLDHPRLLEGVLPVGPGDLSAQPRRGHYLAGVGEAVGVKGATKPLEGVEVRLREHLRHVLLLVDAYAVLAGEGAAGVEAGIEDRPGQHLCSLRFAVTGRVVTDQRVQVAIARVKDIGDPQ